MSSTPLIRLEVPVEAHGPQAYRAVILRSDGVAVWRTEGQVPAEGAPVVLEVPARVLGGNDYHVWFNATASNDAEPQSIWLSMRIVRHC
jgi:hypothetical protein